MASLDLQWTTTTDPYFLSHAWEELVLFQLGKHLLELILNLFLNQILYSKTESEESGTFNILNKRK
jgi:hypothetical protein